MPSTYTTNNGIELIGNGEQSGTWGDTTNTNLTLVDASLDGHTSITLASAGTSGSPNDVPITNGATSNGRNRALIFTDGGDLGADVYVRLTPNDAKKIMFVRNSLSGSRNLILFQGTYNASNDFVLAAGKDAIVKFDGGGSGAVASAVLADFALDAATITTISNTTLNTATVNATTVDTTNIEVTNLKAKDGVSAGSIANSTGVVTLASSVLTTTDINGGTVDGVTIGGSSAGAGTFTTANATTVDTTNIEVTNLKAKDGTSAGSIADSTGVVTLASSVLTTTDINGGTIDGTTIGGSTPAAVTGTTGVFSNDLTVDTDTLYVDSTNNRVGIGTTSPSAPLDVTGTVKSTVSSTGDFNFNAVSSGGGNYRIYPDDATTANPTWLHQSNSSEDQAWVIGGVERMRLDSSGNLDVTGALSKGSGSFKISHPLKPDTHHLVHSFLEGPQADNLYRGTVALVGGAATVNLDTAGRMTEGTFVALNGNVQCFTSNEQGWTAVRGSVSGNILSIEAQDAACTDTVSWMVIGERKDQHMIDTLWTDADGRVITEPEKVEDTQEEGA